jgi:4-hydroxy-tetrahydrodipicolinate reductase
VIRVGVIGHAGRMGTAVCGAVDADDELDLVARIGRGDRLEGLVDAAVEVAVEFTTPESVKDNIRFCVHHGIHVVVGTTGLGQEDLEEIEGWLNESGARVFVAPNFALGAVLMMMFAAQAARYYDAAEIIERHHEKKVDAPSGTALRTAALMDEARKERWASLPDKESLPGSRGGSSGGVRIHSVRLPGSVAHQEVVLGGAGETLTIRHDSIGRSSFAPGVVLAIKRVGGLAGLTVGLERLLDL